MDGLDRQDGKRVVRGARVTLTQEVFNELISIFLGFKVGEIDVLHCSNAYHNQAFELTIKSDNEMFPVVEEGCKFPAASVEIMYGRDEKGFTHSKVKGIHVYD